MRWKLGQIFIGTLFPPYHHEFVISNGRVLIGKVSQPKSLWCRYISQNFRGDLRSQNENIGMASPVKCMYRYLGVQLVPEVHELPTCNFHFVLQRQWGVCLMPTEVSFQRWRKLPFEFLNIFLELFLVRARHFVCYAYNHPVFIILRVLFWAQKKSLQLT